MSDPDNRNSDLERMSKKSAPAKNMIMFQRQILSGLTDALVDLKQLIQSSHIPYMKKDDGEKIADILALAYDGLDKIFNAYMRSTDGVKTPTSGLTIAEGGMFDANVEGWSHRDWTKFLKEFKIIRFAKTLSLNRVFYVHANPINNGCYLENTDAFVDCIVLVAERMNLANSFESSRDRLVWLLHHMHGIAPVTLVAHLRPLFPGLPERPDHRPKPKVPMGWKKILQTIADERPREGRLHNRDEIHHKGSTQSGKSHTTEGGLGSTPRKSGARKSLAGARKSISGSKANG